jgi:hypothetical protein
MKELLESNDILDVDSKKSIFLYFLGLKITRDVDIEICGCEVNFFLQGISKIKTRGKFNFMY